jgi:hypothetical protein
LIVNNRQSLQQQNFKRLIIQTPKQQCIQDLAETVKDPAKRAAKEARLDSIFKKLDEANSHLEHGGMDKTPTAPDVDVRVVIQKGQKVIAQLFDIPTQKVVKTFKSGWGRTPEATIHKAAGAADMRSAKNQAKQIKIEKKIDAHVAEVNKYLSPVGYKMNTSKNQLNPKPVYTEHPMVMGAHSDILS